MIRFVLKFVLCVFAAVVIVALIASAVRNTSPLGVMAQDIFRAAYALTYRVAMYLQSEYVMYQ